MKQKIYISILFLCLSISSVLSQQNIITQRGVEFSVRITVVDENNTKIVKNVQIDTNGRFYTFADFNGEFVVKGKVGNEIRVSHPDFNTVYHILTSSEDIKIVVKDYTETNRSTSKNKSKSKS